MIATIATVVETTGTETGVSDGAAATAADGTGAEGADGMDVGITTGTETVIPTGDPDGTMTAEEIVNKRLDFLDDIGYGIKVTRRFL